MTSTASCNSAAAFITRFNNVPIRKKKRKNYDNNNKLFKKKKKRYTSGSSRSSGSFKLAAGFHPFHGSTSWRLIVSHFQLCTAAAFDAIKLDRVNYRLLTESIQEDRYGLAQAFWTQLPFDGAAPPPLSRLKILLGFFAILSRWVTHPLIYRRHWMLLNCCFYWFRLNSHFLVTTGGGRLKQLFLVFGLHLVLSDPLRTQRTQNAVCFDMFITGLAVGCYLHFIWFIRFDIYRGGGRRGHIVDVDVALPRGAQNGDILQKKKLKKIV